eukprot:TRINITY_DN8268_c0_g2_i1.p1 TRINITY_DN8268_c0_g2~~TRINITY_DN8268_c0_g2_i1.p1  ORF type:complete len:116 (-),score=15.25 TRINITY_DN8268_c0_g2_i1:17-364(-)
MQSRYCTMILTNQIALPDDTEMKKQMEKTIKRSKRVRFPLFENYVKYIDKLSKLCNCSVLPYINKNKDDNLLNDEKIHQLITSGPVLPITLRLKGNMSLNEKTAKSYTHSILSRL